MAMVPGMTELSCVCPRCGTPFSYSLPKDDTVKRDEDAEHAKESPTENVITGQTEDAECREQSSPLSDVHATIAGYNAGMRQQEEQPFSFRQMPHTIVPPPIPPAKKKRGCLRGCLLLTVFLALFIAIVINTCSSGSDVEEMQTEHVTSTPIETEPVEEEMPQTGEEIEEPKDEYEEVHPEPAPDWIQGQWAYDTSYGRIILTIKDKYISETLDGKTSNGTFYYQDGKLHCDFNDGNETIYKLDEAAKQIDAGEGMYMTKR